MSLRDRTALWVSLVGFTGSPWVMLVDVLRAARNGVAYMCVWWVRWTFRFGRACVCTGVGASVKT